MRSARQAGFTLTELMIAVAIAAVLATLTTPSFRDLRARWALRVATAAILSTLAEARLVALAQGRDAVVCASADAATCAGRGTRILLEEASAVRRSRSLPDGVSVTANRLETRFHPWPRAASTVTWRICARDARASREVIVSQAGRPRVADGPAC